MPVIEKYKARFVVKDGRVEGESLANFTQEAGRGGKWTRVPCRGACCVAVQTAEEAELMELLDGLDG